MGVGVTGTLGVRGVDAPRRGGPLRGRLSKKLEDGRAWRTGGEGQSSPSVGGCGGGRHVGDVEGYLYMDDPVGCGCRAWAMP